MSDMLAGIAVALVAVGYVLQPLLRSGRSVPPPSAGTIGARPACPECGARPEADAVFCSSCGRMLGDD